MTQEEILQYNKRCAEFLGWKKCLTNEFDNYGYCQTVDGYESPFKNIVANPQILEYNYSESQHSISDLQFHSDWNWIMEVVEAIEKKSWVNIKGCAVDISTIANLNAPTKKEAVVDAINQFLIWYEQNKTI